MDKIFRFFAGALTIIACAGFAESAQNPKIDCCKASCPSIRPDLKCDAGISFSSDFLYWQTSQTGNWYGQVANFHTSIPNPAGGDTNFFGDYKNPKYKFDPGVRVSFGFRPHYDHWQIDFVWTHMNSKALGSSDLPGAFETSVIIPNPLFFVPQILNNNSVNANATWRSNYNTIDLDINREIPLGKYFGLKGHFGLKNLWLNEKYHTFALAAYTAELPEPLTVVNSESNMVQKIWGIGPMVGLDSFWKVYKGFNLFGKAAFSLVWSQVKSTVLGQFFNGTEPVVVTAMTSNFHTVLPEIDLIVGGEYDINFCDNRYHLTLRAGWELITLFNANFLGASYSSLGDFNMSGLTTGFIFDF
jgi:hypothetical protein